ncbi:hypothetical protein AGMMS49521_3370 [Campylobacterota bacterium]|nr:hypothetical protein AGMMS49521_3370 [Campylobacterota bacterium]
MTGCEAFRNRAKSHKASQMTRASAMVMGKSTMDKSAPAIIAIGIPIIQSPSERSEYIAIQTIATFMVAAA